MQIQLSFESWGKNSIAQIQNETPSHLLREEKSSNSFKGGVESVEIGYSQRQAAKGYCEFKYLSAVALC